MKTTILLLLISLSIYSQDRVSLSIHQDARLALVGDGHYQPFTANILARFKMQGKQQEYGYLIIYPEFEYAEIEGIYKRYSVNAGYTFNKLILDNFETSIQGGWGFIDRYDTGAFSFSLGGELAYKVTDRFKVSLIAQFTERKDLKWMYGDNVIRFSGFLGIEYNLN